MQYIRIVFAIIIAVAILAGSTGRGLALTMPQEYQTFGDPRYTNTTLTFEQATAKAQAEAAMPSVVSVFGFRTVSSTDTRWPVVDTLTNLLGIPIDNFPSLKSPMVKMTAGTGFFINQNGYIITNNHVVIDKSSTYRVALANGREEHATVVYRNPGEDVAILKINGNNYPTLIVSNSEAKTGDMVASIGNKYRVRNSAVLPGRIMANGQTIIAHNGIENQTLDGLVQFNAALAPGDSGGPVLSSDGKVVGMNVATTIDGTNISFAISASEIGKAVQLVTKYESIR